MYKSLTYHSTSSLRNKSLCTPKFAPVDNRATYTLSTCKITTNRLVLEKFCFPNNGRAYTHLTSINTTIIFVVHKQSNIFPNSCIAHDFHNYMDAAVSISPRPPEPFSVTRPQKGGCCNPPGFSIINILYHYVCYHYHCIAMCLLFPLIPKKYHPPSYDVTMTS